jgi:hypothetical protein
MKRGRNRQVAGVDVDRVAVVLAVAVAAADRAAVDLASGVNRAGSIQHLI